jgi:hypothetical protein
MATKWIVGKRLSRALAQSHELQTGEASYRRLRVFTSDPSMSKTEASVSVAAVPYEPLLLHEGDAAQPVPCVCGCLFELWMQDAEGRLLDPPRLDDPAQQLQDGYAPSESNPRFHAQMVYAVASQVYALFRRALGRELGWAFSRGEGSAAPTRLRIFPFGSDEENAWYDGDEGELRFGYFQRELKQQTGWVFTSLSHDIIAHEMTHALLDTQRPHFMEPTSPDVPGFHEGFADLVALFQHFEYPDSLRRALQASRSVLLARRTEETASEWLCCIARQFGQSDGQSALRRADRLPDGKKFLYEENLEEHDMGEVLLSAVFDAFDTVFRRRTARLRRMATGGSGVLPPGELSADLLDALAEEATLLARQFSAVIVRAIDYCPPTDIKLGEFLRAMVTADAELRPDDPWAIREALINAFRVRHIVPRNVLSLSEDSLIWGPPRQRPPPLHALSFASTQFGSVPGRPVPVAARLQQADALGRWLQLPGVMDECGLVASDDPRLAVEGVTVTSPCVDTLETTRRVAPRGEVLFETVAVVTQRATVRKRGRKPAFSFIGGATLLFSPTGELRLSIVKSVLGKDRIKRRSEFITRGGAIAERYWHEVNGQMQLREGWTKLLHVRPRRLSGVPEGGSSDKPRQA